MDILPLFVVVCSLTSVVGKFSEVEAVTVLAEVCSFIS